jgi:hypothetical protein
MSLVTPRLLGLYDDKYDDKGRNVGHEVVGWALAMPDGTAITTSAEPPFSVSLWRSLDDAEDALGVYVDKVDPKRRPPQHR